MTKHKFRLLYRTHLTGAHVFHCVGQGCNQKTYINFGSFWAGTDLAK